MGAKTVNKLAVPGATLHYEVTGTGPVVLMIAGGGTDAGIFDGIVGQLAASYTVVTYDPRGNSRSEYVGAPADERVDQSADDALALLDVVSPYEPAYVFGSSSGAITGLELITRNPDRVRMLVAHEPPCTEVLLEPGAGDARAFFQEVYDAYRNEGVAVAEAIFTAGIGAADGAMPEFEDLLPEYREPALRMLANASNFYAHKLLPFTRYQPDLEALKTVADRIVPAAGTDSVTDLPARPIHVIGDRLGWPVVLFPGGHVGYASHPVPFATHLAAVLSADM